MTEENLNPIVEEKEISATVTFEDTAGAPAPYSPEQLEFLAKENAKPEEELIFGKYKTMEEAEKAHKSLESGFHEAKHVESTGLPSDEQEGTSNETSPEPKKDDWEKDYMTDKVAEGDFELDGEYKEGSQRYNIQHAIQDWQKTGEITPELKENFEKIGVTQELMDHYRGLVESKAGTEIGAMMDIVGGKEKYGVMNQWAETNLSDSEQDIFNATMERGNEEEVKSAITNLGARYEQANQQTQPTSQMIKADAISQSSGGYQSQNQMLSDMADPRYESDPAYRDLVYAKVQKSNF